ncbi:hypothetical protein GLA29479_624 [Lysobacter antibioticus]|nr:hypothetical protein GLA29479_624 [Lysobacter antibioticus]
MIVSSSLRLRASAPKPLFGYLPALSQARRVFRFIAATAPAGAAA